LTYITKVVVDLAEASEAVTDVKPRVRVGTPTPEAVSIY
jgi:hypothetical protein